MRFMRGLQWGATAAASGMAARLLDETTAGRDQGCYPETAAERDDGCFPNADAPRAGCFPHADAPRAGSFPERQRARATTSARRG
jgi:hypothetical protein